MSDLKNETEMKEKLDALVKKFEIEDFIKNDPVQFPHRFKTIEDIEISAFIAALFAYGKRELFIKKLNVLFSIMENRPYDFLLNFEEHKHKLNGFVYRFIKDFDLICFLEILSKLYHGKNAKGLKELFYDGFQKGTTIQNVVDYFYSNANPKCSMGFYHLLPNPKNGGAQKRFNMFLRWMVRDGIVDLGVWNFMEKSQLLIPLDVHVGNVSRKLGLLKRSSNDFKSVIELTNELKKFDPEDPIKYDFALFGAGIENFSV